MRVIKRDMSIVDFDKSKIEKAILKAMKYGSGIVDKDIAKTIANESEIKFKEYNNSTPTIHQIEDYVYFSLIEYDQELTAKAYEGYRAVQSFKRHTNTTDDSIIGLIAHTNEEVINENSNKNSYIASTQRDLIAGEVSKDIARRKLIPAHIVQAHDEGVLHYHDMDYAIQPIHNCIEENGWIYYKDENGIKNIQLKELKQMFDLKDDDLKQINKKCFVLGRNGWTRLKAISVRKTKENENMYEFRTRTGMNLKTTENHKIPVIREGKEITVLARDINKKDILLTTNGSYINPYEYSGSKNYINLLDLDDSELRLGIFNLIPLKNYIKYKYETTIQDLLDVRGAVDYLSISQFKKILSKVNIPYELFYKLKLKAKGSKTSLPLIIPVNESLAKLYGYVYADGGVYVNESQSTYHLTFTNTNTDLIDDYINCFENVFDFRPSKIKPSGTSPCWRSTVGSRLIVKLFKEFCEGKFNGSSDISIPSFIMNGDRNTKLAFLSAAIDCDGTLGDKQITYVTCSEKYSSQILQMINSMGYNASLSSSMSKGSKYTFKHYNGTRNYDTYYIKLSRLEEIYKLNNELNCYKINKLYDLYEDTSSKEFIESKIMDIKIREEDMFVYDLQTESGWFIVNDYVVHNCMLINLEDMLQNGTVINDKLVEKPKSFETACTIVTQIIAQIASGQYGGNSITIKHIAPFLKDTYNKYFDKYTEKFDFKTADELAEERMIEQLRNGVQTIRYQLSTLATSNGQSPFSTIYLEIEEGSEYEQEMAWICEEMIKQRLEGMKSPKGQEIGEEFPKLVYLLDEHNCLEGGKYDYITKLAAKCNAKRLVPDYQSAKIMRQNYEGNTFPPMGCRSHIGCGWKDENGDYKFYGRFNQGVVSLNLVSVALSSQGSEQEFWDILEERLELCKDALMVRHNLLLGTKSDISPIHWQHGGIARLEKGEIIDELLKNGYSTLSLGYVGIYEMTQAMLGVSHTTKEGEEFALKVMNYLNNTCKKWKAESGLGFSLYGTPGESLTSRFCMIDKQKFGEIPNVTDRMYYTNSYHVHVTEEIDAFDKLKFESQFHDISLGGCISYIEVPNMSNNLQAIEQIINFIYHNIQYAEINTKSDTCYLCSFQGEMQISDDLKWTCPQCGNKDMNNMQVMRRTCGYIGSNCWSKGRTQEIAERVLHL